jgi:hypothetical protein
VNVSDDELMGKNIEPETVDPSEIMHAIRRRVRGDTSFASTASGADEDLARINEHLDIDCHREITTHRKLLGPLYVRYRQWIYREFRQAMEPILARQVETNRRLARIVLDQQQRIEQLEETVKSLNNRQSENSQSQ